MVIYMENMKLENITFEYLSDSYPEITVNSLTDEEINVIKNIYTGRSSEFTSIGQYSYQHVLLSNTDELKNFSQCMEKISITEMRHQEILGKILLNSNIDPKYCTYIDNNPNICNFWSANFVNYTTNLKEILIKDIELENVAIREYNRLLNISQNENLRENISRILLDEHEHIRFFEYALSLL